MTVEVYARRSVRAHPDSSRLVPAPRLDHFGISVVTASPFCHLHRAQESSEMADEGEVSALVCDNGSGMVKVCGPAFSRGAGAE